MKARVGSSRHGNRIGAGDEGTKEKEMDPAELKRRKTLIEEEGVGEEEQDGQGFGVGKAPKESKPQTKLDMKEEDKHQDDEESKGGTEGEGGSEADHPSRRNKRNKKRQVKGKQEAFKEYKDEDGKQLEDDIRTNRFDLREKKDEMTKLKEVCNKSKKQIDILKSKLEEKNQERQQDLELDGEEEVIDEEEYSILRQLKEHKKVYRENFDKYKSIKSDAFFVQNSLDKLKEDLIFQFECWYEENFEPPHGSKEAMKPLDHDFSEQ